MQREAGEEKVKVGGGDGKTGCGLLLCALLRGTFSGGREVLLVFEGGIFES